MVTTAEDGAPRAIAVLGAALVVAGAHIGPAATWLPGVRGALSPGLDGRGDSDRVALTFDDGPDPRSTPHFLRALDELRVGATFFVLGSRLAKCPDLGRRIVAEGHELAVHGWHHERPWCPRPLRDATELAATAALVTEISGTRPLWYRPAYGILTGGRWAAARATGLRPVLWTAWGRDWKASATPESVRAEVMKTLRGGATVLLHDSDVVSAAGSWRSALGALPGVVAECRARGLAVGRLDEHGVRRR
ncbi:polysaccharide deacetylase family protein [Streptomyces sp. NPDC096176]|uniref:polysaccharide deacetylase family protein n=1 Tax=Streptomyces sp. NPDC096176 TaxID=3366079 RepID=UPI003819A858